MQESKKPGVYLPECGQDIQRIPNNAGDSGRPYSAEVPCIFFEIFAPRCCVLMIECLIDIRHRIPFPQKRTADRQPILRIRISHCQASAHALLPGEPEP